jgi:signal transduction histidine kinase
MSLIQVQASTARYRVPGLSDTAAAEFDDIARTAREALTEMRRLLGILRTDDQRPELAPQQGVRDLPALVRSARRAGADVAFADPPAPDGLPGVVDIAAFRIVQEALSNAMRHAPGAPVEAAVHVDEDAVRIRVHNDAGPAPADTAARGRGLGLVGMRERAALVGGSVQAGPDAGGWTVVAELPLRDTAAETARRDPEEGP